VDTQPTLIAALCQTSGSSVASDLSFALDQAAWAGFIALSSAPMLPHGWTLQTLTQIPCSCLGSRHFLQTVYAKELPANFKKGGGERSYYYENSSMLAGKILRI